jgi:GAF domain-containing protein
MSRQEAISGGSSTSLWGRIADSLVGPASSLTDVPERQKARLAAVLTLAVSFFVTVGFVTVALQQDDWLLATQSFGLILAAGWLSYFLTRTRIYSVGALIFVLGFCGAPFLVIFGPGSPDVGRSLLIFIPLGLIIGSFLLSPRVMAGLVALLVLGYLALPSARITLSGGDWAAVGTSVAIGVVLILFTSFRNRAERENLQRLAGANAELQSMGQQLEARVVERTEALNRRTAQLEAASFVSRQTAAILDPTILLDEVVQLISDRFGFYHAGIFLMDTRGQFAVLQAASSDGGKRMLARGHRLEVGREGIVGYAAYQKRARIALDVGEEAVFFSSPDLPHTRSEMALPLIVRGKVIGVMDIQSTEPEAFAAEDVNAVQSLADQIALALDNARLLAESQASLKQLQSITTESSYRAWRERIKSQKSAFRYRPTGITPLELSERGEATAEAVEANILRVPINLRGKEIGSIVIRRKGKGQEWSDNDQNLVSDISAQVALALENARLLEDLQRRANREQAIAQAASRFSTTTDMDTLLQLALREFHQLPSVEEVSVVIKQPENGRTPE